MLTVLFMRKWLVSHLEQELRHYPSGAPEFTPILDCTRVVHS